MRSELNIAGVTRDGAMQWLLLALLNLGSHFTLHKIPFCI